jgi:hypothetical protein
MPDLLSLNLIEFEIWRLIQREPIRASRCLAAAITYKYYLLLE